MYLVSEHAVLLCERPVFESGQLRDFAADDCQALRLREDAASVADIDGSLHFISGQHPELDASFRQLLYAVSDTLAITVPLLLLFPIVIFQASLYSTSIVLGLR